ncbi:MAG: hypothetical protein ABR586_07550 [Thermoplasmatota archaeon]
MKAAWVALSLLAVGLAGCSNPQQDTLRAVYPNDFDTSGAVPLVRGLHLEARVGGDAWAGVLALAAEAPLLVGPAMAAPAPQGGGGDVQRLPAANATAEVRIKEASRLGGLTAHWFVLDNGTAPGDLGTAQATLPGDVTFRASISRPGPFLVTVVLTGSSVDKTPQATYAPLPGSLTVRWTATGQVQPVAAPQGPTGTKPPSATPREQMADRYDADVRPGARLVAATTFEGAYMGKEGTDVDVGLYTPDHTPAACGSTGGGQVPVVGTSPLPDPSQAFETAATDAQAGGVWSAEVGAQEDGCNGVTYYYSNAGPVPYRLVLTAG